MLYFICARYYRGYSVAFPAPLGNPPYYAYVFRGQVCRWHDADQPILVTGPFRTTTEATEYAVRWLRRKTGLLGRLGWPNRLANYLLRPLRGWWYGTT